MVLTHTTNHAYSHPFPTVTLAYFLRYSSPQLNPFAAHVLSTDTISTHVDPTTQRLHTTRLHLKKSRLPNAAYKLLPASVLGGGSGGGSNGEKASYILEKSVVDIKEGWMKSESRNLDFTKVLSVVEKQHFSIPTTSEAAAKSETDVKTTVMFKSRLGEKLRGKIGQAQENGSWLPGFLGGLGAKGIQRSIESLASTKTLDQLGKSRDGMLLVLERLRNGGIMNVLEKLRQERQRER